MRKIYPNLSKGRYELVTEEIEAAKRSLYFWWWRYLRLSSDYWWLCKQVGKTTDKAFAAVYGDFGDVFNCDFDKWWRLYGTRTFAYKLDPPRIKFAEREDWDQIAASRGRYVVVIPMFYTKSEILKQMNDLLISHQPLQMSKIIASEHEVGDLRGVRKQVLIDAHRVWCLNDAVNRAKEGGQLDRPERFTQQWIGRKLDILPKSYDHKNRTLKDEANERLAIRVKVNRYLSKANLIIKNVEIGKFPDFSPVAETKRWTKKQLEDKKVAMQSRAWLCPESAADDVLDILK